MSIGNELPGSVVNSLVYLNEIDLNFVQGVSDEGSDDENVGEDVVEPMITGDDIEETTNGPVEKKKKLDRLFARKNNDVFSSAFDKVRAHDEEDGGGGEDDSDADEFLTKKRPREQAAADEFLTKKARPDEEEVEGKQMKAKR